LRGTGVGGIGRPSQTCENDCETDSYAPPVIETIENRYADRPYRVELSFPEFTSICPLTGAPDFGAIRIAYVPSERLLEQKSLRFLTGFRGREIFQEEAVNAILDEVVTSCDPSFCEVEGVFNTRGGMGTRAVARHGGEPPLKAS
jgi:7-cyano-7-deazaguanine reductase